LSPLSFFRRDTSEAVDAGRGTEEIWSFIDSMAYAISWRTAADLDSGEGGGEEDEEEEEEDDDDEEEIMAREGVARSEESTLPLL